jgi:hypothetical protein
MVHHVSWKHGEPTPTDVDDFLSESVEIRESLIRSKQQFRYIKKKVPGHVCESCGKVYIKASSLRSHFSRKKSCCSKKGRPQDVYLTICGRLVSERQLFLPLTTCNAARISYV